MWGGEFYSDKLNLALAEIGHQLTVLYLIHVSQIDRRCLVNISHHCPHLGTLGFYNCEFGERPEETSIYIDNMEIVRLRELDPMEEMLEVSKMEGPKPKIA